MDDSLVFVVHTADALVHMHMENEADGIHYSICKGARMRLGSMISTAGQWMPERQDEVQAACQTLLEG